MVVGSRGRGVAGVLGVKRKGGLVCGVSVCVGGWGLVLGNRGLLMVILGRFVVGVMGRDLGVVGGRCMVLFSVTGGVPSVVTRVGVGVVCVGVSSGDAGVKGSSFGGVVKKGGGRLLETSTPKGGRGRGVLILGGRRVDPLTGLRVVL